MRKLHRITTSRREIMHKHFCFRSLLFGLIWVWGLGSSVFSQRPVDLVYPQLDAANSRWFFFSSASRPFGMVNLFPDTRVDGAWGSGYVYGEEEIQGFSHIHGWQLAGVSVMPVVNDSSIRNIRTTLPSAFSHDDEVAEVGYHRVILQDDGIEAELTATNRVGFHRYTYPAGTTPKVVINLSDNLGPSKMAKAKIRQVSDHELKGYVVNDRTVRRPHQVKVYFHIVFDGRIQRIDGWRGLQALEDIRGVKGMNPGMILTFDEASGQQIMMKVGISYVCARQAKKNMEAELPHWNFNSVVTEAKDEWNEWLSQIEVEGGSLQDRRRFYTDLWHALAGRRVIHDADGWYADYTSGRKKYKRLPLNELGEPEHGHFNSDAFWGAQWSLNILWPLAYPKLTSEFIRSFLQYYEDGGLIPRGPSGGNYTFVMTGASSTPFFVSAYQKGIRDWDFSVGYEALRKNHLPGGLMSKAGYEHGTSEGGGLENYLKLGYVPWPHQKKLRAFHLQGAGQTLEYAYQDYALAQLAKALDHYADYDEFTRRSGQYKNLWDASTGYFRPRSRSGAWVAPFDPRAYAQGFVEMNAAQALWWVPHDPDGLAGLMGGREQMISRLDSAFQEAHLLGFTSGKSHEVETRPELSRIPINYGNQQCMHTAFLFNELGAPWLTQKWSRLVVDSVYSGLDPYTGYSGDEDQGQMGSLAVLMKIGLFQVDGGVTEDPKYQIGSPVFDYIKINLDRNYYPGDSFVIRVRNNSPENVYIQSVKLNGETLDRFWIRHSEIVAGGELELVMGGGG